MSSHLLSFLWRLDTIGIAIALSTITYVLARTLYNLFFHPLSSFPGPPLWAASRVPYVWCLMNGDLAHRVKEFHAQYGEVVRLAPNELSFIGPTVWQDVCGHRPGHQIFQKNQLWWRMIGSGVQGIHNTNDADHARMRRQLSPGFSEKALRDQEPIVQSYVDLLIANLRKTVEKGQTRVNAVDWYKWTTFDIASDLTFGESFGNLEQEEYHPWVSLIYSQPKAGSLVAASRFFPIFEILLRWMIPKHVLQQERDHFQYSAKKVRQRLAKQTDRADWMHYITKHREDKDAMTMDEIDATVGIMLVAGSETSGTALTGATHHLLRNPDILGKLAEEIRGSFGNADEITFSSVSRMPYLNAVLEEGFRMCPPIPGGWHRVVPSSGDTVCGRWVPGNTFIYMCPYAASRSLSNFSSPDAFLPERWLAESSSPGSPYANDARAVVQPFSVGPRSCLGKSLAYAEQRLILTKMIWNFDLSLPGGPGSGLDWDEQKTWSFWEKLPLEMRLTPIHRPS